MLRRPRTQYEPSSSGVPAGYDMHSYLASDDRGGTWASSIITQTIGSAYDRYFSSRQHSSFTSGEVPTIGEIGMGRTVANRMPIGSRMPGPSIPDPFVLGGDPLLLCFVDFANTASAATAMRALQGYRMDEQDPISKYLRIKFSRYPGQRYGSGSGSKR